MTVTKTLPLDVHPESTEEESWVAAAATLYRRYTATGLSPGDAWLRLTELLDGHVVDLVMADEPTAS